MNPGKTTDLGHATTTLLHADTGIRSQVERWQASVLTTALSRPLLYGKRLGTLKIATFVLLIVFVFIWPGYHIVYRKLTSL